MYSYGSFFVEVPMSPFLRTLVIGALAFSLALVTGCVNETTSQGVKNLWRDPAAPKFERGTTTENDVLSALGPPSQVISLGDQTVFYYLLEQTHALTAVLILYNQTDTNVNYDRAIFFFDAKGKLTEFATSHEQIPQSSK